MNGNLILDKVNDPNLQSKWHQYLTEMGKALKKLEEARYNSFNDPTKLEYLQALLDFIEARDRERNYFWQVFVKKGTPQPVYKEKMKAKASI